MTEKHQLLTDQQFELQFENCSLPPALVTYEAHLRLAYIHIKKYGFKIAVVNLCKQLTAFNVQFGQILLISKSSIKAFVKLIYDFIKKSTTTSFRELLQEFPELKTQFLSLLIQPEKAEANSQDLAQEESVGFSVL